MRFKTVSEWLSWQENLHPTHIDLGLDRVFQVKQALGLNQLNFSVVTIAGTNGKGSCVALLQAILLAAGYRVGSYTSPHLLRYNERIHINGHDIDDENLCWAFDTVDNARRNISLTYFEFGTLAAMVAFERANLDVVILEVGLGGRLDAVNAFEPDISLITSIDIDHTDWLGTTRDAIAREKAGILRAGKPFVCGDITPPQSLLEHARQLGCQQYYYGKDFLYTRASDHWAWFGPKQSYAKLPFPNLVGEVQFINASSILMVLSLLKKRIMVSIDAINKALSTVTLMGRFQVIQHKVMHIFDVAHNPQSARILAQTLIKQQFSGKTHALFSMLGDKDISGVITAVASVIDSWHIAQLDCLRAAPLDQLMSSLQDVDNGAKTVSYSSLQNAYSSLLDNCEQNDRIVIFGSFHTVAEILARLNEM